MFLSSLRMYISSVVEFVKDCEYLTTLALLVRPNLDIIKI